MPSIVLIAHDIRSTHNVGSLLRTADGLGVEEVFLTGYTPYPAQDNDSRLNHIKNKLDRQIHKTALGAERHIKWHQQANLKTVIQQLKSTGFFVAGLEQTEQSISLSDFKTPAKIALIVGNEVSGLDQNILGLCDACLMIPMRGKKESFNVAVATAMALYHLKILDNHNS